MKRFIAMKKSVIRLLDANGLLFDPGMPSLDALLRSKFMGR